MASFNIHLAVGKRYLEKTNAIKDEKEFYKGIIEPDLVLDKKTSHYTLPTDNSDLFAYLKNKVLLNEYLKENAITSDYQKGVFLHLITDYLFFNNFFDADYLSRITYPEFCKDLYYSYDETNEYLEEKYKVDYADLNDKIQNNIMRDKKEKNTVDEERENIIPFDKIDEFIEYVSDIDIENYRDKIIENGGNIFP